MFYLCTQVADAAKMPKNNTAPMLARFASWLAAAAKGRELGSGSRVASCERASERCSDENKHQQQQQQRGGHKYKQGTEKKKKEKKGASVPRPSLPIFLHLFIGPSPPRPPRPPPPKQNFSCSKNHEFVSIIR